MTSARRIGAPDAKNRVLLLDAAEQLMLEEGYAAVTSRRLANKAGLKPQLVHYYFRTMEELFVEVFRRRGEEALEVHAQLMKSSQPLWALWRFGTDPAFTRISMEFMALANHRKEMRAEIAYYAERLRDEEQQAVTAALQRYGVARDELPPVVVAVLMSSLSRFLVLEQAIGMSSGHAETVQLVEDHLRRLEGEPQPIEGIAQSWVVHKTRNQQSAHGEPSVETTDLPCTDEV
ncbi:TetR/AcrR family transcriptional regulator [Mycobacterium avium subsp. hominissuis]|uniref:TetR/AcrR family transcriptional regulator n=1 Tax=Mycobacterium avium TaxID=1764 RepID=UPI00039223B2|nr:TetR/AcrR family transcriptional regulator [Mycobacterium avium]APA74611.1 TetR/AcrR family transcriptional regulator [Mycobacterium avium subsp. hominissuis]ATO61575.1 TetR/AcrR family transcriptional regulator [Mycobacterium avium subsp. hominissuis]ATO66128.1 TetR/AcrR family transcriptional regulator [Mycobacterium avium subsp. hominissuis]ATO70713.1 TetR/AcrR family transcriptional regulator [Mycobacterium avium subsp. hominissuis]PBJ41745.1 TetR/AcrR family transcriptional regulator [